MRILQRNYLFNQLEVNKGVCGGYKIKEVDLTKQFQFKRGLTYLFIELLTFHPLELENLEVQRRKVNISLRILYEYVIIYIITRSFAEIEYNQPIVRNG